MAINVGARAPESIRVETKSLPTEQEPVVERPSNEVSGSDVAPTTYSLPAVPESTIVVAPDHKSTLDKEIENVLSEGLEQLYWEMPELQRQIFKTKGERVATQIRALLGEATVRVQDIFRLIVDWLKALPGVSRFFIEQEAKIKTDKLTKLRS